MGCDQFLERREAARNNDVIQAVVDRLIVIGYCNPSFHEKGHSTAKNSLMIVIVTGPTISLTAETVIFQGIQGA